MQKIDDSPPVQLLLDKPCDIHILKTWKNPNRALSRVTELSLKQLQGKHSKTQSTSYNKENAAQKAILSLLQLRDYKPNMANSRQNTILKAAIYFFISCSMERLHFASF